jgi:hypothetical protein
VAGETSGSCTRRQAVLPGCTVGLRRDQPCPRWRTTCKCTVLAATRWPFDHACPSAKLLASQVHMARMGAPAKLYKSHSLRKGGVTAMLAAGVPLPQIQLMAR